MNIRTKRHPFGQTYFGAKMNNRLDIGACNFVVYHLWDRLSDVLGVRLGGRVLDGTEGEQK